MKIVEVQILLSFGCFLIHLSAVNCAFSKTITKNKTMENKNLIHTLKSDIFTGKTPESLKLKPTTTMQINIRLRHVDVDEERGVVEMIGWLRTVWQDDRLRWNRNNYEGLNVIRLGKYEIWHPEFEVFNNADAGAHDPFGTPWSVLFSDGKVYRAQPFRTKVFCTIDLRMWPMDVQKCSLKFRTFQYRKSEMSLDAFAQWYEIGRIAENNKWIIDSVNTALETEDSYLQKYHIINYEVYLKRNFFSYIFFAIIPAICVVVLMLCNFWLPPHFSEKIILNTISIAIIGIMLNHFIAMLPAMVYHTPIIVLFYSSSLVLASISMTISISVIYIVENCSHKDLPDTIRKLMDGILKSILFLPSLSARSSNATHFADVDSEDAQRHNKSYGKDWRILAMAIDRFLFLVYTLIFFGCFLSILAQE